MITEIGNWVLLLALPAVLLYPILFGLFSRFESNAQGQALFWLSVSHAALVIVSLLVAWLGPDYTGREWVRLVVFLGIFATQWWMLVLLIQLQRQGRRLASVASSDVTSGS